MKLQQANYLNAANEERDNFIGYLQDLRDTGQISNRQLQSVQVVTAAWDPKTGKIYLGWKISGYGLSGWCAEDDCAAQAGKDGVDPKTLQFTMALRPRDGGQMRICPNCQADYDEAQFADSGAEGAPGGRWDQIRAQAAALANSSDDVLDEAFGTALSESEELEDEGE